MSNFRTELINAIETEKPDALLSLTINCAYHNQNPGILNLLTELADISVCEFSEKTPTASIGFSNSKLYLRFNKGFIKKYVSTPDCLLFVVLHELMHKIYGDLFTNLTNNKSDSNNFIANIAFDLHINRKLCHDFLCVPTLLSNLYGTQDPLSRVFLPPELLLRDYPKLNLSSVSYEHLRDAFAHQINKLPPATLNGILFIW